jgi:ribonucleoside-diphosphate reductase alpha chain
VPHVQEAGVFQNVLRQIVHANVIKNPEGKMESTAIRIKLPNDRNSLTHNFNVGGHKGIVTVGVYPDGRPGEIFITISKAGSTLHGLVDAVAIMSSLALQYGVPVEHMCDKMMGLNFEPNGWSTNPDIGHAKSLLDYIFRWIQKHFASSHVPVIKIETTKAEKFTIVIDQNAPPCQTCGMLMQQNGSCHVCTCCGTTSGCS